MASMTPRDFAKLRKVRDAQVAYEKAEELATKRLVDRNTAIQKASAGATHAVLAAATGLSRGRVGQIAEPEKYAAARKESIRRMRKKKLANSGGGT